MTCRDIAIRIYESTNRSVIISRTGYIEAEIGIVVITSVAEGVLSRYACAARAVGSACKVAPSIILVGEDFRSCGVINSNNISL